jgi:hypothetical protein
MTAGGGIAAATNVFPLDIWPSLPYVNVRYMTVTG